MTKAKIPTLVYDADIDTAAACCANSDCQHGLAYVDENLDNDDDVPPQWKRCDGSAHEYVVTSGQVVACPFCGDPYAVPQLADALELMTRSR